MAGMRFTLDFHGDTQIDRTLLRMSMDVADARPAWEVLAGKFARAERKQFSSEGGYASGGWAPLSPKYAAWKQRHFPGKPILERTGALKESLTQRPFGVEVLEPEFMVVGSGIDYGAYHQQGTSRMPQRRPVELTEADRRAWVNVIQRFIVTGSV